MVRLLLYVLDVVIAFVVTKALGQALQRLFGTSRAHYWTSSDRPPGDKGMEIHPGEMVRDPICGMFVSTELPHRLTRGATTLHFCSQECLERYRRGTSDAS